MFACLVDGKRRGGKTNSAKALQLLFDTFSVLESDKNKLDTSLPTRKVERAMKYGGLRFVTTGFFHFVSLIELVFEEYLSKKSMVIHGESIVRSITEVIFSNEKIVCLFCDLMTGDRPDLLEVLKFILLVYGRFRGKEFTRKMMGIDTQSNLICFSKFNKEGKGIR